MSSLLSHISDRNNRQFAISINKAPAGMDLPAATGWAGAGSDTFKT